MKERPILFSGAMVRALLADAKTQTRRVVKMESHQQIEQRDDGRDWPWMYDGERDADYWMACPYGQPGDRLWVRETHAPQADCWGSWERWTRGEGGPAPIIRYAADAEKAPFIERWRPSIHMPRWASRITLEVTGVRVERLQEISEADAKAEGADCLTWSGIEGTAADLIDWPLKEVAHPHRNGFAVLWESINGPESWNANPWVWVVSFRRLDAKEANG